MFSWQFQEALRREPSAVRVLVGVYTRDEHWSLPEWFPAAYLINSARSGAAGEHWVGVFLEDFQHAEYFDSYGTTPLESIYQWLRSIDYQDIWYSTKMLQGLFSRSCVLYAGHVQPGCALGRHYRRIPGIRLRLPWGPNQAPPGMTYTHTHTNRYIQRRRNA